MKSFCFLLWVLPSLAWSLGSGLTPLTKTPTQKPCMRGERVFSHHKQEDFFYRVHSKQQQDLSLQELSFYGGFSLGLIGGRGLLEVLKETIEQDLFDEVALHYRRTLGAFGLQNAKLVDKKACEHGFVVEEQRGFHVKLFIRLHFHSKEVAKRFRKTIEVSFLFGLIKAKKTWERLSESFGSEIQVDMGLIELHEGEHLRGARPPSCPDTKDRSECFFEFQRYFSEIMTQIERDAAKDPSEWPVLNRVKGEVSGMGDQRFYRPAHDYWELRGAIELEWQRLLFLLKTEDPIEAEELRVLEDFCEPYKSDFRLQERMGVVRQLACELKKLFLVCEVKSQACSQKINLLKQNYEPWPPHKLWPE